MELQKEADGSGFLPLAAFPTGEPWANPSAAGSTAPVQLLANDDGRLEEQYEVVVDRKGQLKSVVGVIGKGHEKTAEGKGLPGWFEVRARGRFESSQQPVCMALRVDMA